MRAETVTDFLHRPAKFLERVDKEDIVLRRRGKPSVRLSLETRRSGTEVAANILAEALRVVPQVPARLPDLLARQYPWVRLLTSSARSAFAQEFVETLQACASIGNPARLDELLQAWKATAEIHADPALHAALTRPLGGPKGARVPRPSGR